MNIFVINLSSDVERRQFQKQQLSELRLDYKILNAISTDDINKETYKKHYFDWQRPLRNTEVACYFSHRSVWQRIINNNLPALILEDDALLSKCVPELLKSLGAKVIAIGVKPNGLNINSNCGSTYPNKIKFAVKKHKAHLGISLDGDADRIIMCDEKGNIIDGDQIIAALATRWKNKKMLKGGVVGTLMSNYGLEKFFKFEKIKFVRANVGDRYVKEKMQKNNFNLGGEQSGHIILGKFATTGDGLLVALEVLFALKKGRKASDFFNRFKKTPQILENIEVKDKTIINNPDIKQSIKIAEKLMKGQGRILVRRSGTESKIRVMGESENKKLLKECIKIISKKIK